MKRIEKVTKAREWAKLKLDISQEELFIWLPCAF
jgi:hypothetical protein